MNDLDTSKLHVRFEDGTSPSGPAHPRVYTLTHSDTTGDLFLSIGADVNRGQISGWYTRFMRDEVIARWEAEGSAVLHVECHLSGGFVLGGASWREAIFRRHLPMVLTALRYGDRLLFERHPELDEASVVVHFNAKQPRHNRAETWGKMREYSFGSLEAASTSRGGDPG
jgi:hypothetical protein